MRGPYGRKDRLIEERRHDVYYEQCKWSEPTVCTGCGAVFVNGRWTWQTKPELATEVICPACRRLTDRYPAGRIKISGPFFNEHRREILNLIHNVEHQEKQQRPLERVMSMKVSARQVSITTTGIHLARRIGQALARAYYGQLSFRYPDGDKSIRVFWQR